MYATGYRLRLSGDTSTDTRSRSSRCLDLWIAKQAALEAYDQHAASDDQENSQRLEDAEFRPGTKDPEGIEQEAHDQLGGDNEREGPRHTSLSCRGGDRAYYHGPQDARGRCVTHRAARKLRFRHH